MCIRDSACSDNANSFKYAYVTKDEYLSGNIREKIGIVDSYIARLKQASRMLDDSEDVYKRQGFDMWRERFNRTVKRGEKGIPVINSGNSFQKIGYVFDVTQTVSMDRNVNEVELWTFDREKHETVLKEMIELQGYSSSESLSENLYSLSRIYADDHIYGLANNLRIADEDRKSFTHFMRNCISYAISNRFNVQYSFSVDDVRAVSYTHLTTHL